MTSIGFIGLGNMGAPMSANLVKAGHDVTGFDLSPAACSAAAGAGVTIAEDARSAAAERDVVISMLPAGEHVLGLYLGPNGILRAVRRDALLIDSSTIEVDAA